MARALASNLLQLLGGLRAPAGSARALGPPAARAWGPSQTLPRTWVDAQAGEVSRRVLQLLLERLHVVGVHVGITQHMHKVARPEAAHLARVRGWGFRCVNVRVWVRRGWGPGGKGGVPPHCQDSSLGSAECACGWQVGAGEEQPGREHKCFAEGRRRLAPPAPPCT